ncbi:Autophagy-related protein 11 [Frankliniella fusca]|uniref:Autophagy-related protein 11 n=1 Tax=Frankliniella fusca TaxID=407009 RepID=A0AAE1HG99_9NEOP|nr:Autophagy-related protein 11 [Frankliniella fusca]
MSDSQIGCSCDFGIALESGAVDLPDPMPLPGGGEPLPFTFVGDEAFALKTYMMRPYAKPKRGRDRRSASIQDYGDSGVDDPDPVDEGNAGDLDPALQAIPLPRRIFNYRLSRARRVIENTSGIWVSKWQILAGQIYCKVESAKSIAMTLICLHNFLLDSELQKNPQQRNYIRPGFVDGDGPNGEPLAKGLWRSEVNRDGALQGIGRVGGLNPARAAINQREKIKDFFLTEICEVPWQYEYAFRNAPLVEGAL